jgi:putative restriction endonuclease
MFLRVDRGDLMAGRPWTRSETLIAFNLYCRTPFGRLHARNPEIVATAQAIDRTPSSLAMKCCNLAAFDPALKARGVRGLAKASRLDSEIWRQFEEDPEAIGFESEQAVAAGTGMRLEAIGVDADADGVRWEDIAGLDRDAITKVRVNQSLFRSMILAGYGNACSVCALPIARLLVASHIVPWSIDRGLRMNPRNGICLCALHDRAFDCGFLTIAIDYKICIHCDACKYADNSAVVASLLSFDGRSMNLPERWHPDPQLLQRHQALVETRPFRS